MSVLSTSNFQWFLKESALTAKIWATPVTSWLQEKGSTSGSKSWCKSALESLCGWVFLAQWLAFWQGWSLLGSSSAVSPWVLHVGLRDNDAWSGVGSKSVKKEPVLALSKVGKNNYIYLKFCFASLCQTKPWSLLFHQHGTSGRWGRKCLVLITLPAGELLALGWWWVNVPGDFHLSFVSLQGQFWVYVLGKCLLCL